MLRLVAVPLAVLLVSCHLSPVPSVFADNRVEAVEALREGTEQPDRSPPPTPRPEPLFDATEWPALPGQVATVILAEGLSSGVPGRDRIAASALFGVPFAPGELLSAENLTVVTAQGTPVPGSADTLARWPDGSVRWLRVTAQANVPAAGAVALALVSGAPQTHSMLTLDGQLAVIDTGPVRYTLVGADLHGRGIEGSEIYAVDDAGQRYASADGLLSVELNTPALAVVRVDGGLSGSGGRHFDYTARFRFARDSSTVLVSIQFRNAAFERPTPLSLRELGLRIRLPGRAGRFHWNAGDGEPPATLYQGLLEPPEHWRYRYVGESICFGHQPLAPGNCEKQGGRSRWQPRGDLMGTSVSQQQREVLAGGADNQTELRWLDVGGLAIATDLMPATPASGYRIEGDHVDVQLYAGPDSRQQSWGSYRSYRVGLDGTGRHPEAVYQDVSWPVLGRAEFQRYRQSGAFFGETRLLSVTEERDFWLAAFGGRPDKAEHADGNKPLQRLFRVHWRRNYLEPYVHLLDFARSGSGGKWQNAIEFARHLTDAAIVRSDGFDYSEQQPVGWKDSGENLNDGAHATTAVLFMAAAMSAEPWLLEAARDYAESIRGRMSQGFFNINRRWHNYRATLRQLRNSILAYDFLLSLGHQDADKFFPLGAVERLVAEEIGDAPPGADIAAGGECEYYDQGTGHSLWRGYIFMAHGPHIDRCERLKHGFFGPHLSGDTFQVILPVLERWAEQDPARPSLLEDLNDVFAGQVAHTVREALLDNGGFRVYPNSYLLDRPNPNLGDKWWAYLFSWHATELWDGTGDDAGLWDAVQNYRAKIDITGEWMPAKLQNQRLMHAVAHGLLAGKDATELRQMRDAPGNNWSARLPAELDDATLAAMAERWRERLPIGPRDGWRELPVTVEDEGGGRYRVRWDSPASGSEIRLKWSDKPIVEWLGFDQLSRQYQYSPLQYTPWFAAHNVRDEPPLRQREMSVATGVGAQGRIHFAARYK